MKLKILVCCHKEDIKVENEYYLPLHVGKKNSSKDLHITGDDSGDNISHKNGSYCELTGIYWAWKNLKNADYIGLCHYRRYFDFHHQIKGIYSDKNFNSEELGNLNFKISASVKKYISQGYVITPRKRNLKYTLFVDYCLSHYSDDIRILEEEIKNAGEQKYVDAFYKVVHTGNKIMPFNMFIMPWDIFEDYCSWLFGLLEKVEAKIDITGYTPLQKRIFGYMAERLFNVYIFANNIKTKEYPIIFFNDNPVKEDTQLTIFLKRIKNNLVTLLNS